MGEPESPDTCFLSMDDHPFATLDIPLVNVTQVKLLNHGEKGEILALLFSALLLVFHIWERKSFLLETDVFQFFRGLKSFNSIQKYFLGTLVEC